MVRRGDSKERKPLGQRCTEGTLEGTMSGAVSLRWAVGAGVGMSTMPISSPASTLCGDEHIITLSGPGSHL